MKREYQVPKSTTTEVDAQTMYLDNISFTVAAKRKPVRDTARGDRICIAETCHAAPADEGLMAQAQPGRNQAEEQEAGGAGYAFGGGGMLDEKGAKGRVDEAVGDAEEPDDEHKITIEVVDDTHGNLVAKEGTQLIQIVTIKNTYSETPPTGDSRHLFLYASLMITSMMGLCMLYLSYRRKKRKE